MSGVRIKPCTKYCVWGGVNVANVAMYDTFVIRRRHRQKADHSVVSCCLESVHNMSSSHITMSTFHNLPALGGFSYTAVDDVFNSATTVTCTTLF